LTLPDPPVLVITDRRMAARPLGDVVNGALEGGCRWILLREPDLDTPALTALGREIAARCRARGARLFVSADRKTAESIDADGLHLPQRLATAGHVKQARACLDPDALIGISCHSRSEADAAAALGADYITMSPVFSTESKPGYGPGLGIDGLREYTTRLAIPVLALAGISEANAADVRAAGAAGIAVMGNVMRADDPAVAVAALLRAWET
jgi:thiamine-phosphate pyrophosphorylase